MKGPRESQGWGNKRVQFQEPYNKMPKSSGTSSGAWKPVVPFWEREFCESVGLSWNQVCDNNNELEGFENILWWDDSAAFEAFQMAKQRYWANQNGHPYDIPLPSADLYIDEIDWNSHLQEDCELPERNNSSSEEDYRRPYFKRGARGRQGRRTNMSRLETQEHRKPSDSDARLIVNMAAPTGWPDDTNNAPKDAQMSGSMEWNENRKNAIESSKDFTQNPVYIQPSGWGDQHDSGWDVKQTDHSGWDVKQTDHSGWDVKQTDHSGWDVQGKNNMFSTVWEQKMDSGWANQTEPTRNSTVTSKTGWTDAGNGVGNSAGWGDQTQNGSNVAVVGSGWTSREEEKYSTGQGCGNETSGWGSTSKQIGRTGWNNAKDVSGGEGRIGCTTPFIPQERVIATGWGDQFPEQVHPYYQNHASMSAQWNSMPQAGQQWQNQPGTWNTEPADIQYQLSGTWGGLPCNSFHQGGSQGWYQPPVYSQSAWHSNQGYWHPQSQHKQVVYPAPNHHYVLKKERDYRVSNRRNQR
ncbi:hypothetical protein KI387_024237 [Taxus chinensis]|uniref:Uncharacterized protein n=1 Tax=Taxus chinensis TaxID=29808 RepID=A0AA38G5K6_TAXCH|nr:hypothetical protein KI387_024237 [Taxus chinensis]